MASRRQRRKPERRVGAVVLDSGGLSALTGASARARTWLRFALEDDRDVIVSTVVLAESTTEDGARDAEVNRILRKLGRDSVVAPSERTARIAGGLRFRAKASDGIDALVAAAAVENGPPCVVLTSDPRDISKLLAGTEIAVKHV